MCSGSYMYLDDYQSTEAAVKENKKDFSHDDNSREISLCTRTINYSG